MSAARPAGFGLLLSPGVEQRTLGREEKEASFSDDSGGFSAFDPGTRVLARARGDLFQEAAEERLLKRCRFEAQEIAIEKLYSLVLLRNQFLCSSLLKEI